MAKTKNVDEQKVVIPLDQTIPKIEGGKAWVISDSYLERDGKENEIIHSI